MPFNTSHLRFAAWFLVPILWIALALSCSESETDDPQLGGESHWLSHCAIAQDCGDGVCACGVCSQNCTSDADCDGIPGAPTCVTSSEGCGVGICAASCEEDQDCLASGLSCQNGACHAAGEWVCDGLQRVEGLGEQSKIVESPIGASGEGCFDVSRVDNGKFCAEEGAWVEAIVQGDDVVEGVCYPGVSTEERPLQEVATDDEAGGTLIGQSLSGTRVSLGEGQSAPLHIEGEQIVLRGDGVENSALGDVTLSSNNSRVRGVTIKGDVVITQSSNNTVLSNCRIEGNLTIEANKVFLVNCVVLGDVAASGNNHTFAGVEVAGTWNANPGLCVETWAISPDEERTTNLCDP